MGRELKIAIYWKDLLKCWCVVGGWMENRGEKWRKIFTIWGVGALILGTWQLGVYQLPLACLLILPY
jgi:hypothetical protein